MSQPSQQSRSRRSRIAIAAVGMAAAMAVQVQVAGPADAATSITTIRAKVDTLTDAARKAKGCAPLTLDSKLSLAAQRHANDMSAKNYFSHTSKDGTTWIQRIKRAGYTKPAGENIARGYTSSASVLKAWMNSPGHRRNILDCKFKKIGVGYNAKGHYWVQDFGY
ncbi:MAG: CAP domain-containing protein [Sporichthyaceae bacterium]